MCGRYGFTIKDIKKVYVRFSVQNTLSDFTPRYNIAPGQKNPVIFKKSPNQITRMLWGLIPFWVQDRSVSYKTINARSEDIENKPSFKKPLINNRCLVPATHFYEWDKKSSPSTPYLIKLKNIDIFAMAGIYDEWKDPLSKQKVLSYSIITTAANSDMVSIHSRMPLILDKEKENAWLDPKLQDINSLKSLMKKLPEGKLSMQKISTKVNNIKNDNPEILKKAKDIKQKSLF